MALRKDKRFRWRGPDVSQACGIDRHLNAKSQLTSRFDWRFMLPLLVAATLNPINSAMLATVLVPIERDFSQLPGISAWLITALYLTAAVAQPVLGGVADRFGARRTLIGGMGLLAVGAALGAAARDPWTLIASRTFIGCGTSVGFPCAVVMIRDRSSEYGIDPPARLLGLLAIAGSASMAVGPPLGGILAGYLGWRWVFLINLPLAVVTAGLALVFAPLDPTDVRASRARFDVPGIAAFTLAMGGSMLFLMQLQERFDARMLAATLVAFATLIVVEWRAPQPFIDVRLISTNRPLASTYAHHLVLNFVLYCFFYSIPQWSQAWLHLPVALSGFVLLPVAVSSSLVALAPTRARAGYLTEICGCLALIGAGFALHGLGPQTTLWGLMALTFVFGIGNGALNMANQQRMLDRSPREQSGASAGLLRTAQYCGAILSAPLTAFLLAGKLGDRPMVTLSWLMVPLGGLLLVLSLRGGERRLRINRV